MGLWVVAVAGATEVTEMAPGLGARGSLRYGGSALAGSLVEAGEIVGKRRISRHDLDLAVEVAPAPGIALTLDLALTPSWVFRYPDSRRMIVEPSDGSGSYLAGAAVKDTPTIRAGGVSGFWIGAAASPFSEAYGKGLQQSTWRFDVALRPGSAGRNLWTTGGDEKRGAAPGGFGLKLGGAFSQDLGVGEPFLTATWVKEGAAEVHVVDEAGDDWTKKLAVRPASTFDTRFGVTVRGWASGAARVDVDLFLGAQYRTWEDVATGVYLPSVLASARTIPVTTGDSVAAVAGFAADVAANEYVSVRTGADFTYRTPYRLEHVYEVRTGPDTWQVGWFLTVQGQASIQKPE